MMTEHAHAYGNDQEILSLEEFMRLPEEDAFRLELVRGRVVREPRPQALHGRVLARLARLLDEWTEAKGAGAVFADTGFRLAVDPPTVRVPDLVFVSRDRIPEHAYEEQGFWAFAPDLAVEIVSPSNSESEIREKALEYLEAGARLVWVVHPRTREVAVYRSRREVRVLGATEELDGGDVLPGFRLALAALFRL